MQDAAQDAVQDAMQTAPVTVAGRRRRLLLCCSLFLLTAVPGLASAHTLPVPFSDEVQPGERMWQLRVRDASEEGQNINNSELIVKKVGDNLTLTCAVGDGLELTDSSLSFFWTLPTSDPNRTWEKRTSEGKVWLFVQDLLPTDAGRYVCSDGVHTSGAYVAVRPQVPPLGPYCSHHMFPCGNSSGPMAHCIAERYLCDGFPDCTSSAKDEDPAVCGGDPCQGKLQCSDNRCIPREWCCYGYVGCVRHPCCDEHEEFTIDRTGGGLISRHHPQLLQTTLYIVSACLLIFLISTAFLISAMWKARLKRSGNFNINLQTESPVLHSPDDHRTPSSLPDYRYTLVPTDQSGNIEESVDVTYDRPDSTRDSPCPSYSQTVPQNESTDLPSYFDIQMEGLAAPDSNAIVSSTSPIRRPTDFGVSTLGNMIFHARYCPVPQTTEIPSFTDSDSCNQSPGSHTWSNILNSPRQNQIASFANTPDNYLTRNTSENRRMRRANALDRILDRFGLNAPYAVGRNDEIVENQAFLSTTQQNEPNLNRRRRFVSSMLGRLLGFGDRQHQPVEEVEDAEVIAESPTVSNNDSQEERRRPDTPNVLELSLEELNMWRAATGDTYTLNGRTIQLLGANFEDRSDMYSLSLQGLYIVDGIVENLNRFVGRPVSPPPYSEVANAAPSKILGPPPPYVSRENLTEINGNILPSTSGYRPSDPCISGTSTAQILMLNTSNDTNGNDVHSYIQSIDFSNVCESASVSTLQNLIDELNATVGSGNSVTEITNEERLEEVTDILDNNNGTTSATTNCDTSDSNTCRPVDENTNSNVFPPYNLEFIDSDCITD